MLSTHTLLVALLAAGFVSAQERSGRVDLGYEVHEGYLNETTEIYKFSNIRYAQPPIGDLRFAAPVPPQGSSGRVDNGNVSRTCPQVRGPTNIVQQLWITSIIAGNYTQFNLTEAQAAQQAYLASAPPVKPDPSETEDCLFLDVYAPQGVFEGANNMTNSTGGNATWSDSSAGVPVLVWIYGGAYVVGSKNQYDGSGLIESSQLDGGPGLIFVAMNYRLGALGWSSGPTLQGSGGVSNAGLYDQRLAIEWVAENIHLFGGDPNQITVMGESAGGGSVQHQITAYGGLLPVPFQRAISQSPGYTPVSSIWKEEDIMQEFLEFANVTTIAEARNLSYAAITAANTAQVSSGTSYQPTVDGIFVPALPALLLNAGAFAKDLDIMVGHNANEAPAFTPPKTGANYSTAEIRLFLTAIFPGIQPDVVDTIVLDLYPEESPLYADSLHRVLLLISELSFTCNTNYMNRAFLNQTYAYEFQVPPALHGLDVRYTFYAGTGDNLGQALYADIAEVHQGYITNFALYGDPNGMGGLPVFPMQGGNASMNAWNATDVFTTRDDTVNERCAYWQKSLFA